MKEKKKVIVAMSGGVDSSVSAALLQEAGFEVTGMFMKCWSADDPAGDNCSAMDDERMARLAAAHIGIPFYSINLVKEYRARIVQYLLDGYQNGITPNPDMMCNKEIKFGLFFDKAMNLGADYVATGHYARLRHSVSESGRRLRNYAHMQVLMGKDMDKDQSYFLSLIRPEVLEKVLFPIGEYVKPEVRKLAKKFGLPNADRKDSQGICFVGKVDFVDFLKDYISPRMGNIVDLQGHVLGLHEGAFYYTIGQRKGLGLSGGPYFIVGKDTKENTLTVSTDEANLYRKEVQIQNLNWFSKPKGGEVTARLRYRQIPALGNLLIDSVGKSGRIVFKEAQRAVTAGQIAVIYSGEQMFAGGVIA